MNVNGVKFCSHSPIKFFFFLIFFYVNEVSVLSTLTVIILINTKNINWQSIKRL